MRTAGIDLRSVISHPLSWWITATIWAIGILRLELIDPLGTRFALYFPDSWDYFEKAKLSIFDPGRLVEDRPPLYPFIVSLLGRSPIAIVIAQSVIYVLAMVFLASTIRKLFSGSVFPYLAGCLVLAAASSPGWVFWGTLPLTESLALSLIAASIGVWIRWSINPSRGLVITGIILGVALSLLRDSGTTVNLTLSLGLIVLTLFRLAMGKRQHAKTFLITALVWILVGGYGLAAQQYSGRNLWWIYNNTGTRVLVSPKKLDWFTSNGMPMNDTLRQRAGRNTWDDGAVFLNSPDLKQYRAWAKASGSKAFVRYALEHPIETLTETYDDVRKNSTAETLGYDHFLVSERIGPKALGTISSLQRIVLPATPKRQNVLFLLSVLASTLTALYGARKLRNPACVLLVLAGSALAGCVFEFQGDGNEIRRHLATSIFRLRFFSLAGILLAIGAVLEWRSERTKTETTVSAFLAAESPFVSSTHEATQLDPVLSPGNVLLLGSSATAMKEVSTPDFACNESFQQEPPVTVTPTSQPMGTKEPTIVVPKSLRPAFLLG
jgi:hypothetical protein